MAGFKPPHDPSRKLITLAYGYNGTAARSQTERTRLITLANASATLPSGLLSSPIACAVSCNIFARKIAVMARQIITEARRFGLTLT